MAKHTTESERQAMRAAVKDDVLADKLFDLIAEVAASPAGIDPDGIDLRELKVCVHNAWVVTQRDPKVRAARRNAQDAAGFDAQVGDKVRVTNISPRYMEGIIATVEAVAGDVFTLRVDEDHLWQTRNGNPLLRVKRSMIRQADEVTA